MAIGYINTGTIANDGTGDDLREAFIKINDNFEELDLRIIEETVIQNNGSIGEVYTQAKMIVYTVLKDSMQEAMLH